MLFCKNCKHIIEDENDLQYSKCNLAPKPKIISPVTGESSQDDFFFCKTQREYNCGPEAKYFESKL